MMREKQINAFLKLFLEAPALVSAEVQETYQRTLRNLRASNAVQGTDLNTKTLRELASIAIADQNNTKYITSRSH
jgi:hypothetical protein